MIKAFSRYNWLLHWHFPNFVISIWNLATPLNRICKTQGCHDILVEKHWIKWSTRANVKFKGVSTVLTPHILTLCISGEYSRLYSFSDRALVPIILSRKLSEDFKHIIRIYTTSLHTNKIHWLQQSCTFRQEIFYARRFLAQTDFWLRRLFVKLDCYIFFTGSSVCS